jgi:hypothetical protein
MKFMVTEEEVDAIMKEENNKNGLNEKERRISSVTWADNIPRIVAGAGDEPQWGGPEPSPQIYLALLISTHGSKDKS